MHALLGRKANCFGWQQGRKESSEIESRTIERQRQRERERERETERETERDRERETERERDKGIGRRDRELSRRG